MILGALFAYRRESLHPCQYQYPPGLWQDEMVECLINQEIRQLLATYQYQLGWQLQVLYSQDSCMSKLMYRNYQGQYLLEWRTKEQVRELKRLWQWK
jgi:hypothetical protein